MIFANINLSIKTESEYTFFKHIRYPCLNSKIAILNLKGSLPYSSMIIFTLFLPYSQLTVIFVKNHIIWEEF
jgi:hypothetical protein